MDLALAREQRDIVEILRNAANRGGS
jgi:hypothetical protein